MTRQSRRADTLAFPQIAAEPYQTISFKIQSKEIDSSEGMSWEHWDPDTKTLSFQFLYAPSG